MSAPDEALLEALDKWSPKGLTNSKALAEVAQHVHGGGPIQNLVGKVMSGESSATERQELAKLLKAKHTELLATKGENKKVTDQLQEESQWSPDEISEFSDLTHEYRNQERDEAAARGDGMLNGKPELTYDNKGNLLHPSDMRRRQDTNKTLAKAMELEKEWRGQGGAKTPEDVERFAPYADLMADAGMRSAEGRNVKGYDSLPGHIKTLVGLPVDTPEDKKALTILRRLFEIRPNFRTDGTLDTMAKTMPDEVENIKALLTKAISRGGVLPARGYHWSNLNPSEMNQALQLMSSKTDRATPMKTLMSVPEKAPSSREPREPKVPDDPMASLPTRKKGPRGPSGGAEKGEIVPAKGGGLKMHFPPKPPPPGDPNGKKKGEAKESTFKKVAPEPEDKKMDHKAAKEVTINKAHIKIKDMWWQGAGYLFVEMEWSPSDMKMHGSDEGVRHEIVSAVKSMEADKERFHLGTLGKVFLDEFDPKNGYALVCVKASSPGSVRERRIRHRNNRDM
jgi:hypothetical protein